MAPHPRSVKNNAPTHNGETFGFVFGGGCLRTRFDLLFGIRRSMLAALLMLI